jgi:hypothetical protein
MGCTSSKDVDSGIDGGAVAAEFLAKVSKEVWARMGSPTHHDRAVAPQSSIEWDINQRNPPGVGQTKSRTR